MATIGNLVVNLTANTAALQSGLGKARSLVTGFAGTMSGILGAGLSLQAAGEDIAAANKLEAVLRATGGAAGLTATEIGTLASELQKVTNYGDEVTVSAAAVLATFKEIKGDIFKDAIVAAQDMSSVMGQDLQASITQIGKALNDPTQGFTALRRVGVSFTADQEKMIKTLQESGDVLGAQKIILKELQSEFGGAAAAMADPVTQLKNAIGDVGEEIGKILLPYVKALADFAIPFFREWGGAIAAVVVTALSLAAAFKAAAAAQVVLQAVSGPAGWATLAAGIAVATASIVALNSAMEKTAKIAPKARTGRGGGMFDDATAKTSANDSELLSMLGRLNDKAEAAGRVVGALPQHFNHVVDPIRKNINETDILAKSLTATEETIKRMNEEYKRVNANAAIFGASGDKLKAALEKRIGDLTGISKAIEDANSKTDALGAGFDAIGATLAKFEKMGALPQQIDELEAALRRMEAAAAQKDFRDSIQDVESEIDAISRGLTDVDQKAEAFLGKGISQADVDKFKAVNKQLDDMKRADAIKKSLVDPMQKFVDRLDEIEDLKSKGLLDPKEAEAARQKVIGEYADTLNKGEANKQGPGLALKGSREALSNVFSAMRANSSQDPQKQALKIAEQQLAEQKRIREGIDKNNSGDGNGAVGVPL